MADNTQGSNGASPTRRADEMLDQAGQRLGAFAVRARLRAQALAAQSAQAAQEAVTRASQAGSDAAKETRGAFNAFNAPHAETQGASGAVPPAMERADELVDLASQRLDAFGKVVGHRLQTLFAYLKEEGEDIWAEAQAVRRPETPTEAPSEQATPQP